MIEVPVRVVSFGGRGKGFSEDTHTTQVNRAGARIRLKQRVTPGDEIRVVNLENLREADFRVVGAVRLDGGGFAEWGLECLDKDRNIWGIDFPPPLDPEKSGAGALIRCRRCSKESLQPLSLVEIDILESTGMLQRLCDQCGELTSWIYADIARRPKEVAAEERVEVVPQGGVSPQRAEKRAHKRIAAKLPVLVRTHQGEQEISKTENISRGGLAVCLGLKLSVGVTVTVACPYSEAGQNVLQRAEVRRRITVMPDQRWLYGMQYVS